MKKLLKVIFIYIPILIIVILIALFFLITSNFGLTKVVIPITSKIIGMPIVVSSAKLNLMHPYIEVNNLEVGDKSNPFIKGDKIACSFSLSDILFNNTVKVNSILLKGVSVEMVQSKEEKWNAPFMNEPAVKTKEEPIEVKSSSPIKLDISNVNLENINFNMKDSKGFVLSITNFNLSSPSIKNEMDSKIKLGGNIHLISGENVKIYSSELSSDINVNLNREFIPQFLQLNLLISKFNGNIRGMDLTDKNVNLTSSINRDNENTITISSIVLNAFSGGKTTTNLKISGKADLKPLKVNLKANIDPIGCDTINLITNILYGIDLGPKVSLTLNGALNYENGTLSTDGNLALLDASISVPGDSQLNKNLVTEKIKYDLSADFNKKTAMVKELQISTYLNDNELAKIFIQKPLALDWSADKIATQGDMPEIFLTTTKLDLLLLNPFLDKSMKLKGELSSDLKLQIDIAEGNFLTSGKIDIANASYTKDKLKFTDLNITQRMDVSLKKMREVNVKEFNLAIAQNGIQLSNFTLSGNYDLYDGKGNLALTIPKVNPEAINLIAPNFVSLEQAPIIRNIISTFGVALDAKTGFELTKDNKLDIKSFTATLKTKDAETLLLALNSPLIINLDGKGEPLLTDITFNESIKNFELSKLNMFIPSDSGTKINGGIFNLLATVSINKADNSIHAELQTDVKSIDCSLANQNYNKIGLTLSSSIDLTNSSDLRLSKIKAELIYDTKSALTLNGNCFLSLKDPSLISVNSTLNINETLLKALRMAGSDYQRVGAFNLNGMLNFKNSPATMIVDANLDLTNLVIYNLLNPKLSKSINGTIDLAMTKTDKHISLKNAHINLIDGNITIANIQSSGNIVFDSSYQSALDVNSDKLDLYKLMEIYNVVFAAPEKPADKKTVKAKTSASDDKEPAPLDLKNINLVSKINFNDIEYGPLINAKINAILSIKDNKIVLDPGKLSINDSQTDFSLNLNPSYSDGYTYEFKENLTNLDINPFLKTFIEGDYSNTKGNIKVLSTELKGKGFTDANLARYLNAYIVLNCDDISLPIDITKNRILALIVLPIKLISNIVQYLPNAQVPDSLNQASSITNRMLNQKQNLNFKTGLVKLYASNGVVNVSKFDFRGGESDMIKYIVANGTIGFDSSLSLNTNTNLSGVDIPLTIDGTIDSPAPNIALFITSFITKNAVNILNNSNVNEIISNPGQGIQDALQNGAQNLLNNFLNGR
ncbi:MAG: hypothetical protein WCR55_03570 [Lentisphaerota bacterium]